MVVWCTTSVFKPWTTLVGKIGEKYKKCKPTFVVLCVTTTTTFAKHVYTFELQFLLEKLKCEIPRSVFLQNPPMIFSWILDML
jgi:hypothetical protein